MKQKLIEIGNKENNKDAIESSNNIESILIDLHKLGVIVYFNDDILKETIICDPKWFNNVFKTILDFGRKKSQLLIEKIFIQIQQKQSETKIQIINKNDKENSLNQCESILKWIIGKNKIELPNLKSNELIIENIWNENEKRKNSIVDKISFQNMIEKLEKIQSKLIEEGNEEILKNSFEFDDKGKDISQIIHTIDQNIFNEEIINKIIGNKIEKKEFMIDLLIKFDLIIPKQKQRIIVDGRDLKSNQNYLIPFLYPTNKPNNIKLFNSKIKIDEIKTKYETIIEYDLPFKLSSI